MLLRPTKNPETERPIGTEVVAVDLSHLLHRAMKKQTPLAN